MTLSPLTSASPAIQVHAVLAMAMFVGGLLIAGAFTILPCRIMHAGVFSQ